MNRTQERVEKVLTRMIKMSNGDEDYAQWFSEDLEKILENMLNEDAFGTEGQADPRGDGRDGNWSMNHVQGIDQ